MANNNKVTIDADYFAELYMKGQKLGAINDGEKCLDCAIGNVLKQRDLVILELEKERDELKEKIDGDATANGLSPATIKLLEKEKRLAEAERCIEEVGIWLHDGDYTPEHRHHKACEIIRAYREKKEAK